MPNEESNDTLIAKLFADPACPWLDTHERVLGGSIRMPVASGAELPTRSRVILVTDFLAFARSRGVVGADVEALADAWVRRHGGTRLPAHDLLRPLRNVSRRLRGQPPVPQEFVWGIPAGPDPG